MRKLLLLTLISLLLASMVSPVWGSGYRETALAYLTDKYGIPEEKIKLYEGGITELEFTAESFWFAKYTIASEGKSASGSSRGARPMPLPAPEPMPLPAPDMPTASGPAIMPLPPQDVIDDGHIYGGVYIRVKTGEVLELDQMDAYFSAERRLEQQEWERLSKEAGKLDVSLYRKLQGLSATVKVAVWIQPTPLETDDLRAQFAALEEKYPEHTLGMELAGILPYGYAVPDIRGGGVSSSSGTSGYAVSGGDAAISYIVPDSPIEPRPPSENPGAEIMPVMPNNEYRQEYSAFWEELEKIRVQSVSPSLASIKETLDGIGVTYSVNRTSVAADLTVAQIHNIAELSAVSAVFEEAIFTTMDGGDALLARSSAPNETSAAPAEAEDNASTSSYLPLILITAMVLAAALVAYRRRVLRSSS